MEERGTKFSLLVTGIFLLGLLVLAAILKPNRSPENTIVANNDKTQPVANPATPAVVTPTSTQTMLPPPVRNKPAVPSPMIEPEETPSVPAERVRQQILTDCRLKTDNSNDGDSFSVLTNSCEYRFSLYYIDAPDMNLGSLQEMKSHSAYFGNLSEQNLRTVARNAQQYVAKILAHRKFDVITRWERAPEESPNHEITCRAFIYFKNNEGEIINLATLLVNEGLATICAVNEQLPDGTKADDFIADLQSLETEAYTKKRGAWQFQSEMNHVAPVKYSTH